MSDYSCSFVYYRRRLQILTFALGDNVRPVGIDVDKKDNIRYGRPGASDEEVRQVIWPR